MSARRDGECLILHAGNRRGAGGLAARLGPRSRYAAAALAGQVTVAAIGFAGSVVAARLLGPGGKGEYTAWALATGVATFGLAASLPVGLGRAYLDGERSAILPIALRHAAVVLGVLGIVTVPALLAGVDPVPLILCILVAVPAGTVVNDFLPVMQAAKRPWSFHGPRIAGASVFTAGVGLVALFGLTNRLDLAFALWAGGSVAGAAATVAIALRSVGSGGSGRLRDFARRGHGSYIGNLIGPLLARLDQFVLVAIAGPYALGLYSVAVNWAEVGQYVGASTAQSVFEEQRTLDDAAAHRILRRAAKILVPALLVTVASGFFLLGPVFGDRFAEARWALLLLGPGIAAQGLAYTSEQILFARGRGWRVSRIATFTLCVALLAWSSGAYLFGIKGTAAASSLVYSLQFALMRRELFSDQRPDERREG